VLEMEEAIVAETFPMNECVPAVQLCHTLESKQGDGTDRNFGEPHHMKQ